MDIKDFIKPTIICLLILLIFIPILVSCNKQVIDVNYKFNKAAIYLGSQDCERYYYVDVEKWNDYENSDMIQIIDTDGNVYLTHSSNVLLIYEKGEK